MLEDKIEETKRKEHKMINNNKNILNNPGAQYPADGQSKRKYVGRNYKEILQENFPESKDIKVKTEGSTYSHHNDKR